MGSNEACWLWCSRDSAGEGCAGCYQKCWRNLRTLHTVVVVDVVDVADVVVVGDDDDVAKINLTKHYFVLWLVFPEYFKYHSIEK